MKEMILKTLKQIEIDFDVKVLYACESGSRAWGFPSNDSDYDVRFIYVHKPEYYLSIDPVGVGKKKDVIELPINELLDVTGWELTKALKLLRKSNPPLIEWMHSAIVYVQAFSTIGQMKQLSQSAFTPNSCLYHYLNMASNNFRECLKSDTVRIKKYINVLRPLLAARWIEVYHEFPPTEFQTLVEKLIPEGELKMEISILLELKIRGDELDLEPRMNSIHSFLETELPRLTAYAKTVTKNHEDLTAQLDEIFRSTLNEVWK